MIYCARKIPKTKYNKHKELTFRSLKNYSVDIYKETLKRVSFPNYENFDDHDTAHNDFIASLKVVAPFKAKKIIKKIIQVNGLIEKLQIRHTQDTSCTKKLSQ